MNGRRSAQAHACGQGRPEQGKLPHDAQRPAERTLAAPDAKRR